MSETVANYNNNPGNLRPPSGVVYEGQIGVDERGFAIFDTPEAGRRALVNDIRIKFKRGLNNPEAFIDRYAPASKENPEEGRENYKISLASGLGLNSTRDPFPEGSEERLADLIAQFEGYKGRPKEEAQKEPSPNNPFATPIPGLEQVITKTATIDSKPSDKQVSDEFSVAAGAGLGAAANIIGQSFAEPKAPEAADYSAERRRVAVAEANLQRAQQRLQERMANPSGAGLSLQQLDDQYRAAQQAYIQARASATPPVAPTAPAVSGAAPGAAPAAGGAPRTIELGAPGRYPPATGPGSAVYNYARKFGVPEIEAARVLGMGKKEGEVYDLLEQRRAGLIEIGNRFPSETWRENPVYGGLITQESAPRERFILTEGEARPLPPAQPVRSQLTPEEELAQRQVAERQAAARVAEAQETQRLRDEALLARQRRSEASRSVGRAQTAVESRQTRLDEARNALEAARQAGPGVVSQATRPLGVLGATAGKQGIVMRGLTGAALGAYGTMSLNELMDLYRKGNREPEFLDALKAAVGVGATAASILPATKGTSRLKGLGLAAALPMMATEAFRNERARLELEEELKKRAEQVKDAAKVMSAP